MSVRGGGAHSVNHDQALSSWREWAVLVLGLYMLTVQRPLQGWWGHYDGKV